MKTAGYLLSQSHQQLGEEELQTHTNTEMTGVNNFLLLLSVITKTRRGETFTHHLTQPPQQEAHSDVRGAREVELVAQSRREDEIVHVCGIERRVGGVGCSRRVFSSAPHCGVFVLRLPLRVRFPG